MKDFDWYTFSYALRVMCYVKVCAPHINKCVFDINIIYNNIT